MSLSPGTLLGAYEIVAPLGAGGMGEVYRARDTKLNREVAIKVLPEVLAEDPERMVRFEREAKVLASLNHPGIAAIYGLQECGDGSAHSRALVMELAEGPTLADRIAKEAIVVDDALPIARQIAEALEYAHERGVIHRDLKPANVKVSLDGQVKLLDFGLAKALEPVGVADSGPGSGLTNSPTLTALGTKAGVILGTAAYMSPEQARGRRVDRRTDIWSFGCLLYELLAGRRPFDGETVSDVVASVLQTEPDWARLPGETPAAVVGLLRRALRKDHAQRLRDIGEARLLLDEVIAGGPLGEMHAPPSSHPLPVRSRLQRILPWTLAGLFGVTAMVLVLRPTRSTPPDLPVLRYTIPIPGLSLDHRNLPIVSRDGRRIAYVRDDELWVRDFDQLEPRRVAGVKNPQYPFWSPDGRQIGYFDQTSLWRVDLEGSTPTLIAAARMNRGARTPTAVWRSDGLIVFAPSASGSNLLSVPVAGGEFSTLYERVATDSDFHRPSLLPDGKSLVFVVDRVARGPDTISVLTDKGRKDVYSLKGERLDAPVYSPTGHILYQRETRVPGVWALPFSLERLEAEGEPFLVVSGGAWPAVLQNCTLVYCDGQLTGNVRLVWVEPNSGRVTPAYQSPFPSLLSPSLSPDGTKVVAVTRASSTLEDSNIVVLDLKRQTQFRIATNGDVGAEPKWRDDGTIIYASQGGGGEARLVSVPADGSGTETYLGNGRTPDVSKDGKWVVFANPTEGFGNDLFRAALIAPNPKTELLQRNRYQEDDPALSPDAHLLAYAALETGRWEVYVRRFPDGAGRWLVSSDGGLAPRWGPKGDVLYYRNLEGLLTAVGVSRDARETPILAAPRTVPLPPGVRTVFGFDLSPDGSRFLILQDATHDSRREGALTVVQNWYAAKSMDRRDKLHNPR